MRRRDLLVLITGALVIPAAAVGQQAKQHRIAIVASVDPVDEMKETGKLENWQVFFGELRRLGYVEGQNLIIDRYSAEGHPERHADLAKEVIGRDPGAIVVFNNFAAGVYQQATSTIPIVAYTGDDPVAAGLVESLARPGGNITGINADAGHEIAGKKLQLLKEVIPSVSKLALLFMQGEELTPVSAYLREAAARLHIILIEMPLQQSTEAEFRRVFDKMAQDRPDAMLVSGRGEFYSRRSLIVELAGKARLPAMYHHKSFVELGGLISYGDDVFHGLRRMAHYVDRILKGAKPAELPVEQPSKFELVINLKTAKALGLNVPQSLLARADEVIE